MNATESIQLHDIVALLADQPAEGFVSKRPVLLRRGQIGTVVLELDGPFFEVEFADVEGRTYTTLALSSEKLMLLHEAPADQPA